MKYLVLLLGMTLFAPAHAEMVSKLVVSVNGAGVSDEVVRSEVYVLVDAHAGYELVPQMVVILEKHREQLAQQIIQLYPQVRVQFLD